jgi:hypothetical protein
VPANNRNTPTNIFDGFGCHRRKKLRTMPGLWLWETGVSAPLLASGLVLWYKSFLSFYQHTPQLAGGQQGGLHIRVHRPLFEEDDNFTIGALPSIAALESARPVSESTPTSGAANLNGVGHLSFLSVESECLAPQASGKT